MLTLILTVSEFVTSGLPGLWMYSGSGFLGVKNNWVVFQFKVELGMLLQGKLQD